MAQKKAEKKRYEKELERLHVELAYLQSWVKATGARIIVVFEGRDAAGKGGVIKALTERVSPRVFRVTALPAPSDREKTQMFFQRYMAHFPAAGEIVIFDRSWYNRAGVDRVMGFASPEKVEHFLKLATPVEKTIVDSGIQLIKYFLDVDMDEQDKRFRERIDNPVKQWKLSPMDVESYRKWWEYSAAYDEMISRSDSEWAPWWVVPSNDKKRARINCITHLLSQIPYERIPYDKPKLGKRAAKPEGYRESGLARNVVPDVF
ncbi:polyphosphate kinase 2 [Neotabrizicola shimadae]|uniref:ADP/GDP-polyphosphate phosphotransferase n=2 Tax=Neotabrizicola shimadae TaxID=2807096 RepID=A0A8G0ZVD3_9RHOB|nr:polyphosphate kinase 2 [Neotabrizicola shimadae]